MNQFQGSTILTSPYLDVMSYCDQPEESALAGGCGFRDLDSMSWFYEDGFITLGQDYEGWNCAFTKESSAALPIYSSTICVQPPEELRNHSDECGCPFVDTFTDRLRPVNQIGRIPGGQTQTITASCIEGDTLIGGSCFYEPGEDYLDVAIFESGPVPGESSWRCGWDSDFGGFEANGHVIAQCLRGPHPDTPPEDVPILERIKEVENSTEIPKGDYQIVTASCPMGDFLISGGCTLEGVEDIEHELLLLRASLVDPSIGPAHTWECAWFNPAATEPVVTGTATAVCVTPPELVMQQQKEEEEEEKSSLPQ